MRAALILGAGPSGLAAAWRLRRAGRTVIVAEASTAVGGCLHTGAIDGFRFELGASTVRRCAELDELCAAAGCSDQLSEPPPACRRRYLVWEGRLRALPANPAGILTSRVLPWSGRLRLLREPLIRRGPADDESVADFARRRLGAHAAERLVDAMVGGIYAGDPEELTLADAFPELHRMERDHGSLTHGLRRAGPPAGLALARRGWSELAAALAADLDVRLSWEARRIERRGPGFTVHLLTPDGETAIETDRLITALPAAATARLLDSLSAGDPMPVEPAAPVCVVGLGYQRRHVPHPLDGFGFLCPRAAGRRILGAIFTSSLDSSTAPDGHVAITAMLGGRRSADLLERTDSELVSMASDELRSLLGIGTAPVVSLLRRWRPGIPQATSRRAAVRAAARRLEEDHPGLTLLGNWRQGPGVRDCVRAAWRIA